MERPDKIPNRERGGFGSWYKGLKIKQKRSDVALGLMPRGTTHMVTRGTTNDYLQVRDPEAVLVVQGWESGAIIGGFWKGYVSLTNLLKKEYMQLSMI
ncbi:hypothetical protein Tco_1422538, partial [Tanacetum coccineum]